jgi:hypothetical protein
MSGKIPFVTSWSDRLSTRIVCAKIKKPGTKLGAFKNKKMSTIKKMLHDLKWWEDQNLILGTKKLVWHFTFCQLGGWAMKPVYNLVC